MHRDVSISGVDIHRDSTTPAVPLVGERFACARPLDVSGHTPDHRCTGQ